MIARNTVWTRALVTVVAGLLCACSSEEPANTDANPDAERVEVARGLLARIEAKPEKAAEVAAFLEGGLSVVNDEPGTVAWFGVRFGPTSFGVFDVFADDAGRDAHLNGKIPAALGQVQDELLAAAPSIELLDVLASKLPKADDGSDLHVGLLGTLKAQAGKEGDAESFLEGGAEIVEAEPQTAAWFAVRGPGYYGIFDVFADKAGRDAHLHGKIPAALASQGAAFLDGQPDIKELDVAAAKMPR